MFSSGRRWFGRSESSPTPIAVSGFGAIDAATKLEEENWEWYSQDAYYPVHIGETFRSRYQVLGKLGYGAHSTAWLGRDLLYVAPDCLLPETLPDVDTRIGYTEHSMVVRSRRLKCWGLGMLLGHYTGSRQADLVFFQTWELFEGEHLFKARGPTGDRLSKFHLAAMHAILGPPSLDYLRRSETSWEHLDKDGT
nr:serine/threonine-protein kinase spk-1 [Quercus suber]